MLGELFAVPDGPICAIRDDVLKGAIDKLARGKLIVSGRNNDGRLGIHPTLIGETLGAFLEARAVRVAEGLLDKIPNTEQFAKVPPRALYSTRTITNEKLEQPAEEAVGEKQEDILLKIRVGADRAKTIIGSIGNLPGVNGVEAVDALTRSPAPGEAKFGQGYGRMTKQQLQNALKRAAVEIGHGQPAKRPRRRRANGDLRAALLAGAEALNKTDNREDARIVKAVRALRTVRKRQQREKNPG